MNFTFTFTCKIEWGLNGPGIGLCTGEMFVTSSSVTERYVLD